MYKLSRFNYSISNLKDELLLYNTYIGTSSFTKLNKNQREQFLKYEKYHNMSENLKETLIKRGFLIPIDQDENIKLNKAYLEKIADTQLRLIIIPTMQCNFRCVYCYENFHDEKMSKVVQEDIVKFVSYNIEKYSGLYISWFGGEPLIALDIIENLSKKLIDVCARHRKPYIAEITTNGYLLEEKIFRNLLRWKVLYYQITIDGLKEMHDRQRILVDGGATFTKIINNLLQIKKNVFSRYFKIIIRTNFSKEMVQKVKDYKIFYAEKFGDDSRFQFFIRPVMDWGGERIKQFQENLITEETFNNIYQELIREDSVKLPFSYFSFLEQGGCVCYAGLKNEYVITEQGDILKCTCDLEAKENKIGILREGKVIEDEYQKALWLCDIQYCSNNECFFAPVCFRNACPAERIKHLKRNCPLEKEHLADILLLIDSQNNQAFKRVES